MADERRSCVDCGTKGCDGKGAKRPDFCLTDNMPEGLLEDSLSHYAESEEADILRTAATVEHDGYLRWCRVQGRSSSPGAWATGGSASPRASAS